MWLWCYDVQTTGIGTITSNGISMSMNSMCMRALTKNSLYLTNIKYLTEINLVLLMFTRMKNDRRIKRKRERE